MDEYEVRLIGLHPGTAHGAEQEAKKRQQVRETSRA
jgi:hypothetical protein